MNGSSSEPHAQDNQTESPLGDDPRDHAKRVQFFHAAEPLFNRFGFKKTTVEEICQAAQASKRTFYELFTDKGDVFIQLLMHVTDEMVAEYEANVRPDSTAVERLDRYLEAYLATVQNRPVFRLIMEDPKLINQLTSEVHSGKVQIEASVAAFTELIAYGISTGEFRRMEPDIITWIVHALMDGLYLIGLEMHPREGMVESPIFLREVRAFILHGLGVRQLEDENRGP